MTDTQVQAPVETPPPAPETEVPVFVWAIVMLPNGEIKLVTELPFAAQRQALTSDVVMTGQFVIDAIKAGKL